MLVARRKRWFSQSYALETSTGEPVAELDVSLLKEGARLHLDGKTYRIERASLMSGPWQFRDGDELLFEATKPSMLRNRFLMLVKGASLELAPKGFLMRRFVLVGPDWADLGEIRRTNWLGTRVDVDLSELVPREAQLFLFFLALVIWRRADRSAAG